MIIERSLVNKSPCTFGWRIQFLVALHNILEAEIKDPSHQEKHAIQHTFCYRQTSVSCNQHFHRLLWRCPYPSLGHRPNRIGITQLFKSITGYYLSWQSRLSRDKDTTLSMPWPRLHLSHCDSQQNQSAAPIFCNEVRSHGRWITVSLRPQIACLKVMVTMKRNVGTRHITM